MRIEQAKLLRRKFTSLFPNWFFIEYVLLCAVITLANIFPIKFSTWMARRVGEMLFLIMRVRRKIVFDNLTIAFGDSKTDPEKRKMVLESYRNMAISFMEFFRIPRFMKISAKHMRFKGYEHMERAFAGGKGLVLAMAHIGPWEYMGVFSYLKGFSAAIMGKAIRNPYVYRRIKAIRETVKLDYIDKKTGVKPIFSKLKENYAVGIVIDQWAGNDGIWVDFFGTPTSTTPFPARLAKKTGCPLLFAYCVRVAAGEYEVHVEPEIPFDENDDNWVRHATGKLNLLLEEKIRAYPGQWIWMHKRWKNKKHEPKRKDPR